MQRILYRTFKRQGGRHYIYPAPFDAKSDEITQLQTAAPPEPDEKTSFLLPIDPNTPFYQEYKYTSYDWDSNSRTVTTDTGIVRVDSISDINDPNNPFQLEGSPPSPIDLPPATVVDEFRVADNPTNPKFMGLAGRLVRIRHLALGSQDIAVEAVNELVLLSPSITSIPPPPSNSQQQAPGQVIITVKAKDEVTPIAQAMVVEARLLTYNNTVLAALGWSSLTPNVTSASTVFDITLPGRYTYEVRVTDEGYVDPFLHFTDSFDIKQVVAGVAYALSINSPIASSPTTLGRATGTLTPSFIGGPGVIDVRLTQDTVLISTNSTGDNASKTSASSVVFRGLVAGEYTVTASLRDSSIPGPVTGSGLIEPPDLEIGDQLTFLPWVQPALGHAALVQQPPAAGLRPTLALSATLVVDADTTHPQSLTVAATKAEIYGPGDVLGINQRAILATVPQPDAVGFSPLHLAAIDFKEEDLPWRYSTRAAPAVAATADTAAVAAAPLPWCLLLVLRADEFEALPLAGRPLPAIRVKASDEAATHAYPSTDVQQQKLWAHVQVNTSLGTPGTPATGTTAAVPPQAPTASEIDGFLRDVLPRQPDLAYARVLCPRRLEADTAYQAFLVPALEGGRLAGLGRPFDADDIRKSAIPNAPDTTDTDFPVYFQWKFATGSEEDFESLVTQLHPANAVTSTATPPSLAVHTATSSYELPLPALLVDAASAPADPSVATQQLAVAQYLHAQLGPGRRVGGRPVVIPPLYGRAYMVTPALLPPTTAVASSWKHTLNLDPRYRALAALGAQVVQDNQEEYVRRAWEQVQDLLLANDKLRGAQYGLRTTAGLRAQHLPLEAAVSGSDGARGEAGRRAAAVVSKRPNKSAPETAAGTGVRMADYGLHLTGLALSRVRISTAPVAGADVAAKENHLAQKLAPANITVREAIRRSSTPLAAFSPTFRRIMKPFGNYLVGAAGLPLRPTQEAPAVPPTDLWETRTSLPQRDAVISQLAGGQLTAAPTRAEQVRAYQFLDDKVDKLLASGRIPSAPALIGEASGRFSTAFASFRTRSQNSNPDGPSDSDDHTVHFRKQQYVRPALPLNAIKEEVLAGTQPGPAFQIRIKQASPVLDIPPIPVGIGDFDSRDFEANDFYVTENDAPVIPAARTGLVAKTTSKSSLAARLPAEATLAAAETASPEPLLADLPVIKQAKVVPVFRDAMGEALRRRHPELFVPGLGDFPAGGVAVLDVNQAFIEAYMVGLNHALGSELRWRGFPVDSRGTFFQQFWDVSEHFNTTLAPGQVPSAAEEAAMLDIKPLDQWLSNDLGANAPAPRAGAGTTAPLRLALRSELLRRYPNLVLALQSNTEPTADPALMRYPLQRLAVGQDLAVVVFDVAQAAARAGYKLVLLERPGQPKFGLDELAPAADQPVPPQTLVNNPLSWNDFSWEYLGTEPGQTTLISPTGRPHATAEPGPVAYLTDSATVAYALFQEPIMATIPLSGLVD